MCFLTDFPCDLLNLQDLHFVTLARSIDRSIDRCANTCTSTSTRTQPSPPNQTKSQSTKTDSSRSWTGRTTRARAGRWVKLRTHPQHRRRYIDEHCALFPAAHSRGNAYVYMYASPLPPPPPARLAYRESNRESVNAPPPGARAAAEAGTRALAV